jgi:hypothetical protein
MVSMDTPKRALDVLTVAEPCTEDWERMSGDARVRHCGLCQRNVYNLSAMSADEAETVLREREGRICVRFYKREDGTITTTDCAPDRLAAARRKARRALIKAGVMVGGFLTLIGAGSAAALFGYHELLAKHSTEKPCELDPVMGEAPDDSYAPTPVEPPPDLPAPAPELPRGS